VEHDKALERQLRRLVRQLQAGKVPATSIIKLSAADSLAVMDAILHPKPAGPRLRRAVERYKAIMGDQ